MLGCILEPAALFFFRAWHGSLGAVFFFLVVLDLSCMDFGVLLPHEWFEGTGQLLLFAVRVWMVVWLVLVGVGWVEGLMGW